MALRGGNRVKSKSINASLLEKILILLNVLIFCATFGLYYFLSSFTKSQADVANQSLAIARSSQKNIDNLRASYQWMKEHPGTVDKTSKIVAEATHYRYQDQVINDLESYASQVGLNISKYTFNELAPTPATPSSTPPQSSSNGVASGTATAPITPGDAAKQLPSNLTTTTIDIGLEANVPFNSVLLFIKKIEQNVTRMQITSLSLTPNVNNVNVTMTISVFINKGS